ncbi:MAG: energy transducer TonB [Candidatus Nitrotoga sp.]
MNAGMPKRAGAFKYAGKLKQPLTVALLISLSLHTLALFSIGFVVPDPRPSPGISPPLEVVLVNSKSKLRPVKADSLAQHNLDGGGNSPNDRRAKTSLPALHNDQNMTPEQSTQHVKKLEQEVKQLLTQVKSTHTVGQDKIQHQTSRDGTSGKDLVQRSLEIARLEAEINKNIEAYQKMPRRKFVGARTQEFRFAQYVEDWRIKVERIGNLNYPEAVRQKQVYGSVQITVSILADGKIENLEISRSSGKPILDAAALRIVKMAAPFAPLPVDIRHDVDILGITRTMTFTLNNNIESE